MDSNAKAVNVWNIIEHPHMYTEIKRLCVVDNQCEDGSLRHYVAHSRAGRQQWDEFKLCTVYLNYSDQDIYDCLSASTGAFKIRQMDLSEIINLYEKDEKQVKQRKLNQIAANDKPKGELSGTW